MEIELVIKSTIGNGTATGHQWKPVLTLYPGDGLASVDLQLQGNGTSFEAYYGRKYEVTLPSMREETIRKIFDFNIKPLFAEMLAGYTVNCNGQNRIGSLTDDGIEAWNKIQDLLCNATSDVEQWDCEDWIQGNRYTWIQDVADGRWPSEEALAEALEELDDSTSPTTGKLLIIDKCSECAATVWAQGRALRAERNAEEEGGSA